MSEHPSDSDYSATYDDRHSGGGKATPPGKFKFSDKNSDEYKRRRERNNIAVKKSRIKSKEKAEETQRRVNELKEENERLEAKIQTLSKELVVLKELFLEHARNGPGGGGGPGGGPAQAGGGGGSSGDAA
ncbi:CCAAT/enhancer-binding protein gamma-like [Lethenteron reissneri]|uniref:CCAAT/enhancer-binding protein gamma-like n=1 Tax=Lethenteron reissneri TaxID=7753 RepID=UPI002AB5FB04|nr:CCAAT/enhancer-binding protein gamma-like [Lethenteron reissneri]